MKYYCFPYFSKVEGVQVAGEWILWIYSALWYRVMASLWIGPWGEFSVSRASAFAVDVCSVMCTWCWPSASIMWIQGFWIMLGFLTVDIYAYFFNLLPVSLLSSINRWCKLAEDVLCMPPWMAAQERSGWKSQSSACSGRIGVTVLGMQQAALQRLLSCSLSQARCRDSLKGWGCCLIHSLRLSDVLWALKCSSVYWLWMWLLLSR